MQELGTWQESMDGAIRGSVECAAKAVGMRSQEYVVAANALVDALEDDVTMQRTATPVPECVCGGSRALLCALTCARERRRPAPGRPAVRTIVVPAQRTGSSENPFPELDAGTLAAVRVAHAGSAWDSRRLLLVGTTPPTACDRHRYVERWLPLVHPSSGAKLPGARVRVQALMLPTASLDERSGPLARHGMLLAGLNGQVRRRRRTPHTRARVLCMANVVVVLLCFVLFCFVLFCFVLFV